MGVCPGWHAAKASLARDVTPLRVRAFASSGDSDTSSALLLRAFTDSSEVPMFARKICGGNKDGRKAKLLDM